MPMGHRGIRCLSDPTKPEKTLLRASDIEIEEGAS